MEMRVLSDRITSLKLENPDISFRTDIKLHGYHLTKEQLNRFVKHSKDCFPCGLYKFGLINENNMTIFLVDLYIVFVIQMFLIFKINYVLMLFKI